MHGWVHSINIAWVHACFALQQGLVAACTGRYAASTLENGKLLQMALLLSHKYISIIFYQYSVLTQMLVTKVANRAASATPRRKAPQLSRLLLAP